MIIPRFLGTSLGSVSLVTDGAGNTVSESRYAPFGEVRWTRGASLTDFSFTGQRRDGFGLIDFNARYLSPLLGRFISADTIIPDLYEPQNWDRFSYVRNNPVNFVDPSGHMEIQESFSATYIKTREERYNEYLVEGIFSLPDFDEISHEMGPNTISKTIQKYKDVRKDLFINYGWRYVGRNGKILDRTIISIIIQTEFGSKSGEPYAEALEGLSRQYYSEKTGGSVICQGSCDTISEQISWLTIQQGFRDIPITGWEKQYNSALDVMNQNYQYGASRDSWHWGNVTETALSRFSIVYQDEKPDFNELYFIVHR